MVAKVLKKYKKNFKMFTLLTAEDQLSLADNKYHWPRHYKQVLAI